MWFLALMTVVGSGLLLAMSIFPGVLEQIPRTTFQFVGGMYLGMAVLATLYHLIRPPRPDRPRRWKSAGLVLGTLLITPILLTTHVPRSLMFRVIQPDLESLLPEAPRAADRVIVPLNADLAVFWIDQWGTDRRGGTYFRTLATGQKRTGTSSHGFAYRPNDQGSPFGDRDYRIHRLAGDWYTFSVQDE